MMVSKKNFLFALYFFLSIKNIYTYDYDIIILGGGVSGLLVAHAIKDSSQQKIAIIEENDLASTQVYGEDAVKALSRIGCAYYHAQKPMIKEVIIDKNHILSYVRNMVFEIRQLILDMFFEKNKMPVFYGKASFVDEHTICLNRQSITAEKFIIATDLVENEHTNIQGLEEINYLTTENFFLQDTIPESIIIVGSNELAIEMACSLAVIGVKTTLVLKYGLFLPSFDYELVALLYEYMENIGIDIRPDMKVVSVKETENRIYARCINHAHQLHMLNAQALFIAKNYVPNIKHLNLDALGITYNERGIIVDEYLQTAVKNIYACGNVTYNSDRSTRIAEYQAKIAGHNVQATYFNPSKKADYTHASRVVFATFPLVAAGLTEQEALKVYGNNLTIYKVPYAHIKRAHIDNSTFGVGKFICTKDGYLVGAHILGECASELIDEIIIGKKLSEQYTNYFFELRTPPSYFDLIWHAAEQSRMHESQKKLSFYGLLKKILNFI